VHGDEVVVGDHALDQQREAFAVEGPGASLDDIARRAGVGAGTVHRHFPTKDELLVAVLAERLQDLADAVGALVDAEDPAQRSSPSFAGSRRTRDRTPRSPPPSPTPAEVGDTVREASRALQDGFGALLERAQAAGAVRADLDVVDLRAIVAGALAIERQLTEGSRGRGLTVITEGLRP